MLVEDYSDAAASRRYSVAIDVDLIVRGEGKKTYRLISVKLP